MQIFSLGSSSEYVHGLHPPQTENSVACTMSPFPGSDHLYMDATENTLFWPRAHAHSFSFEILIPH